MFLPLGADWHALYHVDLMNKLVVSSSISKHREHRLRYKQVACATQSPGTKLHMRLFGSVSAGADRFIKLARSSPLVQHDCDNSKNGLYSDPVSFLVFGVYLCTYITSISILVISNVYHIHANSIASSRRRRSERQRRDGHWRK